LEKILSRKMEVGNRKMEVGNRVRCEDGNLSLWRVKNENRYS